MPQAAQKSPPVRPRIVRDPQKSRVTNGGKLLPGIVDERSAWCRRAKDVIAAHINSDLGGEDNISVAERSLIRRVAVLTTQLEMLEARFAAADGIASESEVDLYIRGAGALRRLLEALSTGMPRRQRDVKTLSGYLGEALTVQWPTGLHALMAFLQRDVLVDRLTAAIDRIANTPFPLAEREQQIAKLEEEIDRLQRTEEAIVVSTDAPRERGCPPWVVLGAKAPGVHRRVMSR